MFRCVLYSILYFQVLFFVSDHFGVPSRAGFLKSDWSRFDAGFFGISPKVADTFEPSVRLILPMVYESLVDAGECVDRCLAFLSKCLG